MELELDDILKGAESYLASHANSAHTKAMEFITKSIVDTKDVKHRIIFQLFAHGVTASREMGLWQAFQRHMCLHYAQWGLSEEDCKALLHAVTMYRLTNQKA